MNIVTVITGGAGLGASGIGQAIVKKLHAQGHSLAVLDIQEPIGEILDILSSSQHKFYKTDLTDIDAVRSAASHIKDDFGHITHLVNNAGGALPDEFERDFISEIDWDLSIQRNLSSQYYILKNLLPLFDENTDQDKTITLMSSINAVQGYGLSAYSAAKAGILGMMYALAPGLGKSGIRINTLLPGTVVSDGEKENKNYEMLAKQSCLGKMARANDVATAVLNMINTPHLSGSKIVLDGGQSIFRSQK